MRLINGGNLTSFHSGRMSVLGVNHTEERTVPVELQLVLESKLSLLLYAAQDIGQITSKLGTVKEVVFNGRLNLPTDPRMVSKCHGFLTRDGP